MQVNQQGGADRTRMGFPLIPFAALWPIIQFLAVPLIRAILPWLLERMASAVRNLTDDEIKAAVSEQESTVKASYRG